MPYSWCELGRIHALTQSFIVKKKTLLKIWGQTHTQTANSHSNCKLTLMKLQTFDFYKVLRDCGEHQIVCTIGAGTKMPQYFSESFKQLPPHPEKNVLWVKLKTLLHHQRTLVSKSAERVRFVQRVITVLLQRARGSLSQFLAVENMRTHGTNRKLRFWTCEPCETHVGRCSPSLVYLKKLS